VAWKSTLRRRPCCHSHVTEVAIVSLCTFPPPFVEHFARRSLWRVVVLISCLGYFAILAGGSVPSEPGCTFTTPVLHHTLIWMVPAEALPRFWCCNELFTHTRLTLAVNRHFDTHVVQSDREHSALVLFEGMCITLSPAVGAGPAYKGLCLLPLLREQGPHEH
jgi:hypothetical protein